MSNLDVPSPIDLRNFSDAREWERTAQSRPGRNAIFQSFASELNTLSQKPLIVLELGSGPGFLAEHLLRLLPDLRLTLLDFSPAMHSLARTRLAEYPSRTRFYEKDFKDADWINNIDKFDAVITNQAIHELRHKQHATTLHRQVKCVLKPDAPYLVCDHFYGEGGLSNASLYMTINEQAQAIVNAGFTSVKQVIQAGTLVMHRAA
ncbi:MAG: class I SAM-dependent methyltransferase [Gammaproteobacteria bacterium]